MVGKGYKRGDVKYMKFVVDSSVFISALGQDETFSIASRKFLKLINETNIVLPSLVVVEVINVLRRQKYKLYRKIADYLLSFQIVNLDDLVIKKLVDEAHLLPDLKTADTLVLLSADITKATLITWDKKLLNVHGKYCTVYSPEEYLRFSLARQ